MAAAAWLPQRIVSAGKSYANEFGAHMHSTGTAERTVGEITCSRLTFMLTLGFHVIVVTVSD